jgi:prepilin-type processing-associated H-X9-DG protein
LPNNGAGAIASTVFGDVSIYGISKGASPGGTPTTPISNVAWNGSPDGYSVFYYLLPYIEQQETYDLIDPRFYYNITAGGTSGKTNIQAAQKVIASFLCPTNPLRPKSGADALGYGYTDYGATVYTDIDPAYDSTQPYSSSNVMRNTDWRADGGLHNGGSTHGQIRDGLSKTIAIAEDAGRTEFMPGAYPDPGVVSTQGTVASLPTADATAKTRAFWRWIEADSGFGVSGPSNQSSDATAGSQRAINNNSLPQGGPSTCPWNTVKANCGPNDEIYSFHGDGANVVFMDGHVTFLDQAIDAVVLRRLVTAYEGVALFDPPGYPGPYTSPSSGSGFNTSQTDTPVNLSSLKTVDY